MIAKEKRMNRSILEISLMLVRNNPSAYGGTRSQLKEEFKELTNYYYDESLDIYQIYDDAYLLACYRLGFNKVLDNIKFNKDFYSIGRLVNDFYIPINSFDDKLDHHSRSKCATSYLLGYANAIKVNEL